jgi:hypothetical protein
MAHKTYYRVHNSPQVGCTPGHLSPVDVLKSRPKIVLNSKPRGALRNTAESC